MASRKILVLNPNTAEATARKMEAECRKVAASGTQVDGRHVPESPSFNSMVVLGFADLARCTVGAIQVAWQQRSRYDGIIVAGFSDVGVDAIRELLDIPVIGIAEAAYHTAALLGHRFSVLTGTAKWTPPKQDYLKAIGIEGKVASIRPYSEWDEQPSPENLVNSLIDTGRRAILEDQAEVLILGSGPLVGYGKTIERALGVPVIDPTLNALKVMEGLIDLGLKHSKVCRWKKPKESIGDIPYNRGWLDE